MGTIIPAKIIAQGFNHNWLLGYTTQLTVGHIQISTANDTVFPEQRKMAFYETQGNISDANGNLLLNTNGCWIANSTGDTMQNGSNLNPGLFTSDWNDSTSGLPLPYGNITLPFPGDTTKYVLFHQTGNYSTSLASTELYYSIIDITLDGGLGSVTLKNQIAFQDTLSWGIGACKHANGRDWWIVILKDNSHLIYKILFTPNGVSSISTQSLNVPTAYQGNAGQPSFSPDGTKFAYTYGHSGTVPFHDVRLFHFNRCTGDFSDTTYIPFYDNTTGFGLAFSPNSKYLYHSAFDKIYQINTDTNNIAGTVDTIAHYDGFHSPNATNFWLMYLAANGKIFLTSGGPVNFLHYINEPDSGGIVCDVQQHALQIPCYNVGTVPNHPNYYLECDTTSGCPCLATGIHEPLQYDFHFSVSPNPTTGNFKIIYLLSQNKRGIFEMFDVSGRRVYSLALPQWSTLQMISLPELTEGLYQCVITAGNTRVSRKVAVINE